MSTIWTVLSVILTIVGVVWGLFRLALRFNQMLVSGRLGRTLLITLAVFLAVSFIGGGLYISGEFLSNKGPDDWGCLWHAENPVSEKYGKGGEGDCSYQMESFKQDANGSGSGTYHIRFEYGGDKGTVLCHYDKASRKFDHDEIVSDK